MLFDDGFDPIEDARAASSRRSLRRSWTHASEHGRTEPDQPARAYLKTIAGDPEVVHLPANGYTLFGLKVVLGPDGLRNPRPQSQG
jgi:hypothetical protein